MLALIIIMSSIIVTFVLKTILARLGVSIKIKFPVLMVVTALSIIGVILIFLQTNQLNEVAEIKKWSTTQGTIISSEVVVNRAYRPDGVYEYTVNGRMYSESTDLQMPAFGGRRTKYDAATKLTGMYPAGQTVSVYYNPENPSLSKLKTGVPVEIYLRLSFGVSLLCIGLFFIFNYFFQRT